MIRRNNIIGNVVVGFVFVFTTWTYIGTFYNGGGKQEEDLHCYNIDSKLDDILQEDINTHNNIFFHETSCKQHDTVVLNTRQACAIESAARANPNYNVFLIISSTAYKFTNILVQQILSYPNVKIRHVNFERYLQDTPLQPLVERKALQESNWPLSHASDFLRFATLFRFCGTYLDLDVIVRKSFEGMRNFVGAESPTYLNSAIVNFGCDKLGRQIALKCAQDLAESYNPGIWGYNGPGVITRVIRKQCGTLIAAKMTQNNCKNFTVYSTKQFYPVSYFNWTDFFNLQKTNEIWPLIENSHSVHVWNKISGNQTINVNEDTVYTRLARQYCPKVLSQSNGFI